MFPVDIVHVTGLAKSTVSVSVERLLAAGLIREEARAGGKRRKLKVAESAGCVLGVDLGQSHLGVGLCDLEGVVLDSVMAEVDLLRESPGSILARVVAAARILGLGFPPAALSGIGLGLPGPVDYAQGVSVSPPVMPGWDRFPIAAALHREFTCPVFVDNDVNILALAERDRGAAAGARDFLFVKVGSGIGAGLVVDGRIYRGAKGAAGDIGHIRAGEDTTLCHCGNRGCLEAVAGGRALAGRAAEAARSGTSRYLAQRLAEGAAITCERVAMGAAVGDEECLRLLITAGKTLGDVLAKLVNFFNPALIVVGGGLSGLAGSEIVAGHWNGQIGAQAQFLAAGVGGQIKAFADVLAGEIEKRLGRLQNRRFSPAVAGLRERQQQCVRPCGGSGRARGGGLSHLDVQITRKRVSKKVPRG